MDKSFTKGLTLIEALADSEEARGVTSLANQLGLEKSNIYRLLQTLAARGYVSRVGADYELSSKIWELGVRVRSRLSLVKVAQNYMQSLSDQTGETVHLSILDHFDVIYVDKVESRHPLGATTRIGGRAPAPCLATGKAMLANTKCDARKLKGHLKRYTKNTIIDPAKLNKEFELIRKRGYSVNKGEWADNLFGVAACIKDGIDHVVGAIGVSGPASRFKAPQIEAWSRIVVDAAAGISKIMGRH